MGGDFGEGIDVGLVNDDAEAGLLDHGQVLVQLRVQLELQPSKTPLPHW